MNQIKEQKVFGGWQNQFEHQSNILDCTMQFSIFLPPQSARGKVPGLLWLSGLTCNDENFSTKAGAQRMAAELGVALLIPDTSPRGDEVPDDPDENYDLGLGAGFYINATQQPWAQHYKMEDYIIKEFLPLTLQSFPLNGKFAISGHSMGGHGALTLGLKYAARFTSVSAFSPIIHPTAVPWGQKAFKNYLGPDKKSWHQHDALLLMQRLDKLPFPILVDQGSQDPFLDKQLKTHLLSELVAEKAWDVQVRMHEGYDHSYYFIQSFMEDHLRFHHKQLLT